MKPAIAITIGDFNGVGPEVALKSAATPTIRKICRPVLIGSLEIFEWYAKRLKQVRLEAVDSLDAPHGEGALSVLDLGIFHSRDVEPGKLSAVAGTAAALAIHKGVRMCLDRKVSGLVTSPVSKSALNLAGYHYPGQTEMLAELTESEHVTMMLLSEHLRVGLVSVHIPIRQVPDSITIEKVFGTIENVDRALRRDFGIRKPRIAVLGLNPHAGEDGLIGTEDEKAIAPAIELAKTQGVDAVGPLSSDGFFGNYDAKKFHGVVAMYHDQGLIPLKMSSFGRAVNYSAGLKIIRTSPDHGTAFEIAGRGIADPGSMVEAIRLAARLAKRRKGHPHRREKSPVTQ
jgi:4-hydroxythreonine-4-phosphate dehydrogenase